MTGGIADALDSGDLGHVVEQGRKIGNLARISHLATVGVDVLTKQIDLFDTLIGQASHFNKHVFKRARHFFATRIRHDAVAAVLGAAFHDADKGARTVVFSRRQVVEFFDLGEADVDLRARQ